MKQNPNGRMMNDMLFLINLGFMAAIILLLIIVQDRSEKEHESPSFGNLRVEARWESGIDTDVDLWVQAPYEGGMDLPVGYSNKCSVTMCLLRDDLGAMADTTDTNSELQYSTGLPDGEYIINLHLYNLGTAELPVPVTVRVGMKSCSHCVFSPKYHRSVELLFQGHELTVMRFRVESGRIVEGSENTIQKPIRSIIEQMRGEVP